MKMLNGYMSEEDDGRIRTVIFSDKIEELFYFFSFFNECSLRKYIELLEKHKKLLEEHIDLQKEYNTFLRLIKTTVSKEKE